MTRVWSLSRDETQESQLYFVYKNDSKLLSFDSGYELSLNSDSVNEVNHSFELNNNFNDFEESDDYSNANQDNRYQESDDIEMTTTATTRAQSSPIPIPHNNRRHKKTTIFHSKSSITTTHSNFTIGSSSLSIQSIDSVHCLIGHPPYDCGCIRGYRHRHPFLTLNATQTIQSPSQSQLQQDNSLPLTLSCNNQRQRQSADTGAKKRWYPLPDIISSSQNRSLMNEIIREIGSDLRRISKDFISTQNQTIKSANTSTMTGLIRDTVSYILNEIFQLF